MKLLQAGTLDRRITIQQKSVAQEDAYALFPGIIGSNFSVPDSELNSISGDIDIRVKAALDSWNNTSSTFIAKDNTIQRSFLLYISSSTPKRLRFLFSTATSGAISVTATVDHGIADGETKWIRVTRISSTGVITFYLSNDGQTWTQLGDSFTRTSGSLIDSSSSVRVGGQTSYNGVLLGKIYKAQVYSYETATLAVDFNPASWLNGSTWTSSIGETWTINGTASVVPTSYGTEVVTWSTFASRIAAQVLDSLPSRAESVQGQVIVGTRPARVRIRYRAGIKPDMRIIMHDGATDRTMQIVAGPAELGRKEGIELMVDEYTTQGGA